MAARLGLQPQGIAGFDGKLPVAVKTLSSTKPNVVKQFNEEANLMKELSHPNIIALLGKYMSYLLITGTY